MGFWAYRGWKVRTSLPLWHRFGRWLFQLFTCESSNFISRQTQLKENKSWKKNNSNTLKEINQNTNFIWPRSVARCEWEWELKLFYCNKSHFAYQFCLSVWFCISSLIPDQLIQRAVAWEITVATVCLSSKRMKWKKYLFSILFHLGFLSQRRNLQSRAAIGLSNF